MTRQVAALKHISAPANDTSVPSPAKAGGATPLDDVPIEQRANTLFDRALALGSVSDSLQRLLELTRRDDADFGPVVEALSHNASVAAEVLRAANSANYGQARKVADLNRAASLLGMQELHDLAASMAMMAAFTQAHPLSDRLQNTAVISASVAKQLASLLGGMAPSAAYLSGLLCEIGALACLAVDPPYAALFQAGEESPASRYGLEQDRYETTTPALGGLILRSSALPSEVAEAVAATGLEPTASPAARIIAFSRVAAIALLRARIHGDPDTLRLALTEASSTVGLASVDPEVLFQIGVMAAKSADFSLGPAFTLSVPAPAPTPPQHSANPKQMPVHSAEPEADQTQKPNYGLLGAGAVAIAAGLAWWFLGRG